MEERNATSKGKALADTEDSDKLGKVLKKPTRRGTRNKVKTGHSSSVFGKTWKTDARTL